MSASNGKLSMNVWMFTECRRQRFNAGVMGVVGFAFDPAGHLAILIECGVMSLADLRFFSGEAPEDRKVPMAIKVRAHRAETKLTANVDPHSIGLCDDTRRDPPARSRSW
jgi:hypothetical protein